MDDFDDGELCLLALASQEATDLVLQTKSPAPSPTRRARSSRPHAKRPRDDDEADEHVSDPLDEPMAPLATSAAAPTAEQPAAVAQQPRRPARAAAAAPSPAPPAHCRPARRPKDQLRTPDSKRMLARQARGGGRGRSADALRQRRM